MRQVIIFTSFLFVCMLYGCAGVESGMVPMTHEKSPEVETLHGIGSDLLSLYQDSADSLKREAAEYLLAGLPQQWHYDTQILEETGAKKKVMDVEVIDADYLAENIEYAFRAWELPWARDVSFEDFCRYLLPYKMGNEAPERWRSEVWEEYASLREAALAEPGMRPSEVCRRVDAVVNTWYTVHYNDNYPTDAGYLKAKELRGGTCAGSSLMILYPLRALGVCATYECEPSGKAERQMLILNPVEFQIRLNRQIRAKKNLPRPSLWRSLTCVPRRRGLIQTRWMFGASATGTRI